MSFSGRVKNTSHEGGVIVAFEGKPPRLGASIRISGGKVIGRVDTVLGPVKSPFVHVHPLMEGIDAKASIGSPVEIAPRLNRGKGRKSTSGGETKEAGTEKDIQKEGRAQATSQISDRIVSRGEEEN